MANKAIVTDLNRCVGCLACMVACKAVNNVPIGSYWNKVLRIGPSLKPGATSAHDVEMYYLPVQCQHCENPECVKVCPTQASHVTEDGTVQIDKSKCIGCQFCAMACPYGVRSWNAAEKCAEKCTLCGHLTSQDKLPACVKSCAAGARFYGDLDDPDSDASKELAKYSEGDIHTLQDVGNHPATRYIMTSMIGQWQDRIAPADHPHTAAYPVAE